MSDEAPAAQAVPPPPDPNAPLTGAASTIDRQALLIIIWVCFSVATCFVALRLTVRWRQNARLLPDDYWITWAWMCMLTMTILQTQQMESLWYLTYLGAGRIAYDPEAAVKNQYQLTRWQFPIIKLFWITVWSVKASFLSLFFRLIQGFPILRRLWYAVCVFAALALLGCILASTLTCSPPSDYFHGGCDSPKEIWMQTFNVVYSTSVDIATDLMIMGLPIAALPSLQLDLRKKIALGFVFGLGFIIICVAIVRMTQVVVGDQVDLVGLAIWGAVETATALVVGSLPPLKSIIARGVRKVQSSRGGGKSSSNTNGRYGDHSSNRNTRGTAGDRYGHGTSSRAAIVSESIPLDGMHKSTQVDGGIYVQKTFTTFVDKDDSSRDGDDEMAIIRQGRI